MNLLLRIIGGGFFVFVFIYGFVIWYWSDSPVQPVKVYELPASGVEVAAEVESSVGVDVFSPASGTNTGGGDLEYIGEAQEGYKNNGVAEENSSEACCPEAEDEYLGQDSEIAQNVDWDTNPVSAATLADSKRHYEQGQAEVLFDQEYSALGDELKQLESEWHALLELDIDESLVAKLKEWEVKYKAVQQKMDKLNREKP